MKHKRLMALLLALAMMITFMPAMAFADDNANPEMTQDDTSEENATAKKEVIQSKPLNKSGSDTLSAKAIPLAPTNVMWDGTKVVWDAAEGATSYVLEIRIRTGKGDEVVSSGDIETTSTSYDAEAFFNSHKSDYSLEANQYEGMRAYVYSKNDEGTSEKYGDISGDNSYCNLQVPVYKQIGEDVPVLDPSVGSVTGNGYYMGGQKVTLTITPAEGYSFIGLNRRGVTEKGNEYSFIADVSMGYTTATFSPTKEAMYFKYDIGEGHESLAKKVYDNYLAELKKDDPALDRSRMSINGAKLVLPYDYTNADYTEKGDIIRVVLDNLIEDALGKDEKGNPIRTDGEELFVGVGLNTIDKYDSYMDLINDTNNEDLLEEGTVFYAIWAKPIKRVEYSVKKPICGTEVVLREADYGQLKPTIRPVVSTIYAPNCKVVEEDPEAEYLDNAPLWEGFNGNKYLYPSGHSPEDMEELYRKMYSGVMTGGNSYYAKFMVRADFGYFISADTVMIVNNKRLNIVSRRVYGPRPIDDPTGYISFSEGFYPNSYGDSFAEVTACVTIDHEWGKWVVTRKPTASKKGEETRTCKHCGAKETRPIPKKGTSPKTADESYPVLWITVMLMATAMLACTVTVRIRQRRRRSE